MNSINRYGCLPCSLTICLRVSQTPVPVYETKLCLLRGQSLPGIIQSCEQSITFLRFPTLRKLYTEKYLLQQLLGKIFQNSKFCHLWYLFKKILCHYKVLEVVFLGVAVTDFLICNHMWKIISKSKRNGTFHLCLPV